MSDDDDDGPSLIDLHEAMAKHNAWRDEYYAAHPRMSPEFYRETMQKLGAAWNMAFPTHHETIAARLVARKKRERETERATSTKKKIRSN